MPTLPLLALLLALALTSTPASAAKGGGKGGGKGDAPPPETGLVWPVSGTHAPDLPQSSAFGPRLKASEGYRYDFHRGIDIPVPVGTPVRAVGDGVVRLAGDYSFYADTVVQLRHTRPGKGPNTCSNRGCYYATYLHLSAVAVVEGQSVQAGEVVGYSGASGSGFEHLHFEIRDGGIYQRDAINPWTMLPYVDTPRIGLEWMGADLGDVLAPQITLRVSTPADELDLARVRVTLYSADPAQPDPLASQEVDFEAWNRAYTPTEAPNLYLDDPGFNGLDVAPAPFHAASTEQRIELRFRALALEVVPAAGALRVVAEAWGVANAASPEARIEHILPLH